MDYNHQINDKVELGKVMFSSFFVVGEKRKKKGKKEKKGNKRQKGKKRAKKTSAKRRK